MTDKDMLEIQQLRDLIGNLGERIERLEAAVYHPSDRVHEILRLKRAGREKEARELMLRKPPK